MLSVSDILKLLDQLPIWKTVKDLPARVTALEARVAALEAPRLATSSPGQVCPGCGAHALRRTAAVTSSTPFGALGAKDETWTCSACGAQDERLAVR